MKITVINKVSFDKLMQLTSTTNGNVEKLEKTFFISINDNCGTDEIPYFKEDKGNVKVLFFHDVENDIKTNYGIAKAFTLTQAKDLFEFIKKHKDKQSCIIHCAAGISRSGAVGTFINDYIGGDFFEFKKANPYIHPNPLVLKLLKEVSDI